MLNPYEVLGVKNGTSVEDCKKAYKKLCKIHHPDNNGGNREKFDEVNKAWNMINDVGSELSITDMSQTYLRHYSLFKFRVV